MDTEITLLAILAATGLGSATLVAVSGAALLRRRSWPYFLVTVALGSLVLRTCLGALTLAGVMSLESHHVVEHFLDGLIIGLLFAAVYAARTVSLDPDIDNHHGDEHPE